MPETILEAILSRDNNYADIEARFLQNTGSSLVSLPFLCLNRVDVTAISVNVVVPAWNVVLDLPRCLIALGNSDYVNRHPGCLQVIVVDDGSTDGTADAIETLKLPYELVVLRQPHLGRAQAMNTGMAFAEGAVIISCDSDMVISPLAISEAALRVDMEPNALYAGFRRDMLPSDASVTSDALASRIPIEACEFWDDNRFNYHWAGHLYPGWPRNIFAASKGIKDLGLGRAVLLPDGDHWSLPRMVYGALYAFSRSRLEELGGFDESFVGWGYEDTFFVAKAIAAGMYIVPVPTFTGIHLSHRDRTPRQSQQGLRNRARLNTMCRLTSMGDVDQKWKKRARSRVTRHKRIQASAVCDARAFESFVIGLRDLALRPVWQFNSLAGMGLWHEASRVVDLALREVVASTPRLAAEVARRAGDLELIERIRNVIPGTDPATELEFAFALCEQGNLNQGLQVCRQTLASDPQHREVRYLQRGGAMKHLRRARQYLDMGLTDLAHQDVVGAFLASQGETPLNSAIPGIRSSKRSHFL